MKTVLLVNPWIYDFAAYDLWLKPWGLLKISAILKKNGFRVYFVDALDRHHPLLTEKTKDHPDGTGKFPAEEIKKPDLFKGIPRRYKRYGLPIEVFKAALPEDAVDIIFVSSGMTYWYPGAFEAIRILKERYPGVPVVLGGTYATLAYEHALEKSGADHVIKNKELGRLSALLGKTCDFSFENILGASIDYDWYEEAPYAVLRLSLGCPFDCAYCAQKLLSPGFMIKSHAKTLEEIEALYGKGIRRFAFYDDALLVNGEYIKEYLKELIKREIKADLYTPNGLHARCITSEVAELLKESGFKKPVLSLETADDEKGKNWHNKVTRKDLENAVTELKKAGYKEGEYMVYLLMGAPGSDPGDVEEGIEFAASLGAKISLSEFSPIPGTPMAEGFPEALKEPLLQNNTLTKLWGRVPSS